MSYGGKDKQEFKKQKMLLLKERAALVKTGVCVNLKVLPPHSHPRRMLLEMKIQDGINDSMLMRTGGWEIACLKSNATVAF